MVWESALGPLFQMGLVQVLEILPRPSSGSSVGLGFGVQEQVVRESLVAPFPYPQISC